MNTLGDLTYSKKEVYFLNVDKFVNRGYYDTVTKVIMGISGVEKSCVFNEESIAVIFYDGVNADVKMLEIYQALDTIRARGRFVK